MRRSLLLVAGCLLLVVLSPSAFAQGSGPRASLTGAGEIRGKLVDSASGRPVTGGSITIRRDTTFAGGALPKEDGTFRVDGLTPGTYSIRVRSLGFAPFARTGLVITAESPIVEAGTLMLKTVATKLAGEQVVAEREETVVQPDRTSYSTKNMTAAAGGTAIDVLRNIPQVEVDGSNRISLRGNGNVVVQINGRSTPLKGEQLGTFLAQMPAGTVKNVEVASNPSAKDDPEGTAGIVNIVLNQEAELGLSGGVNAGTSTTRSLNASGNIGQQRGRVTGFGSLYLFRDRRNSRGTISRENLVIPVPSFVETALAGEQRPLSLGGNLRGEYRFSEIDAVTFDGYGYSGRYAGSNTSSYTNFSSSRSQIGAFNQQSDYDSRNTGYDIDVAFRRQGKPTAPQLTIEAEYANNANTNEASLSGIVIRPDPSTPLLIPTERNHSKGSYPYVNAKVDYTHPFNPLTKLESGAKYQDRSTSNDFTASYLNTGSGAFEIQPARSRSFDYREHIGGAYALVSRRLGRLQAQGGLRLESARTIFTLPLTGEHFEKQYNSAYPSAVATWNFTEMRALRTSYSRRVSRPNPYQLSPIEYRQDLRNVFRGNPDLGAEYSDALDFSFTETHTWGSLQLNPYIRRSNNAVRNIQYVDASGVSVSTFANLSHNQSFGTDVSVNYRRGPFTGALGGGMSYYTSDASNLSVTAMNLSTRAFSWSLRGNGTWKFSNILDAQGSTFFRPATRTEGGSSIASINMNAGVRYKPWGEKGNISFRVNDPFGFQKFGYRTANGQVVEYSERFFGARAAYLTITKNFGEALRLRPKSDSEGNPAGGPPAP
ncbi:MAG: TonB-dependent receptor [Gemmatimonadaceae bacterium]|nr:TonB-dependent receptor [Gemmatimonadaceae bacterium]